MMDGLNRVLLMTVLSALTLASARPVLAGEEKALAGSYTLAKRVRTDGTTLTSPDVIGFMTFTKTRRTVIMRWPGDDATPVSIAFIANYSLSGEKYCESVAYGVQSNLGAPGVSYDTPTETKTCTAAISDASGLSFDVPNESLRLRVVRDEIIATTPRHTDYWQKVK